MAPMRKVGTRNRQLRAERVSGFPVVLSGNLLEAVEYGFLVSRHANCSLVFGVVLGKGHHFQREPHVLLSVNIFQHYLGLLFGAEFDDVGHFVGVFVVGTFTGHHCHYPRTVDAQELAQFFWAQLHWEVVHYHSAVGHFAL